MNNHSLQIGSILYSSWGYEQTNINFYEITKLIGTCTVELRELAQTQKHHGTDNFYGKTNPVQGLFISEPFKKRVNEVGRVKINDCQRAQIWNGEALFYSSYA